MNRFLYELNKRNPILYWFGWYNLLVSIGCILLMISDHTQLLGINRWIKPFKFYTSVGIMVWTMGWILHYLRSKTAVLISSLLILLSMFFENAIIIYQAWRKETSHFNISSPENGLLFTLMGVFIGLFTLTVIFVTVLFFRQKRMHISQSYCWGIRLGLLLFIIFSLEGGIMIRLMSHTIFGPDGGPGLPLVNWSTRYGDLRIAHFMGLHALQFIPLAGYYFFKTKKQVILFSITYCLAAIALLVLALLGMPLIPLK